MKIVDGRMQEECSVGDLAPGDAFSHDKTLYIRVTDDGNARAVNLRTGEVRLFAPYAMVVAVEAEVRVKGTL